MKCTDVLNATDGSRTLINELMHAAVFIKIVTILSTQINMRITTTRSSHYMHLSQLAAKNSVKSRLYHTVFYKNYFRILESYIPM